MKHTLIVSDSWDIHIINLIKDGLSDEKIVEQIPFGSEYVSNLRRKLKEFTSLEVRR